MTPREIIEAAAAETFTDSDGAAIELELLPGFTAPQLRGFTSRIGRSLSPEIKELLTFTCGFEFAPIDQVDFSGRLAFEAPELFPRGVPIAPDGAGNFWVVDVGPLDGLWAPVFYASHDPAVIVWQAATLSDFLVEVFNLGRPGVPSALDRSAQEASEVWANNSGIMSTDDALASGDDVLTAFVERLHRPELKEQPTFDIADLRGAARGDGMSWGRWGARTNVKRHDSLLLFAIERPKAKKKGLLGRIFGR